MSRISSATWSMLSSQKPMPPLPRGLDGVWDAAAGLASRCVPRRRRVMDAAARVLALEHEIADLTDARLRQDADDLRAVFRRNRQTREERIRAFALVREVAFRCRGEKPYAVQVAGAMALEAGCVAEMATGEGKTLTATMPATMMGWRGRGCHIITVNDYLARRDAELMAPIYEFCGLKVAWIDQEMAPADRRQAYLADITYCTNKEVTADFLRDRLSLGRTRNLPSVLLARIADGQGGATDRLVQRGLHYALVDEADSVLIDEAVTPLIISGSAPNDEQVEAFEQAAGVAAGLEAGRHYRVQERYREIDLSGPGRRELEARCGGLGGLWSGARRREELVVQALTARHFYVRDKQYVVDDGKVVIVDEFTGRLMPDRTWRDGLHQAVEAKEGLEVNPPKDTYARVSFQRFFRSYRLLAGMTGTAREAWREFWQIYRLPVVVIPTHRACVRRVEPDRVFAGESAKWAAVVDEVERVHALGRPILIGTRSVGASERLSEALGERGLEHQVLNAVRHAEEAKIVARAGQEGSITEATNKAGRGTDIKLGAGVAGLGGLHIVATERHESGRIDRQLVGRAARQGDPGSAQAFVSLEDELVLRHTPRMSSAFRRRYGTAGGEASSAMTRRLFDGAQRQAERLAFRQRRAVLATDHWLDEYLGFAGSEG